MVPNPPTKLKVIIVEDEGLFRQMLRLALSQSGQIEVVGDFADGPSALEAAPALQAQVALLDIELGGGMNGIQLGRLLRRQQPDLGVVLLSHHRDPAFLLSVPEPDIAGWSYLLKQTVSDVAALLRAVLGAAAGFVVLDPNMVRHSRPKPGSLCARLTPRQKEILDLVAQGFSNAEIARRLHLARKTVENQLNALYQEAGIDHRDAAMHPRVKMVLTYLQESRPG